MPQPIAPTKKPISIQGELGSYSHIAANALFGEEIFLNTRKTFEEVFEDIEKGLTDIAVVPIENSTYGSIYQNYDNISKFKVKIVAEIYVKINFHIIGRKGTKISEVKTLYSHPVGLAQINSFLKNNSHIESLQYQDTAGAVKMISELKENKHTIVAAASKFAAQIYGLDVLKEDVHENSKNYTRFYAIAKSPDVIRKYISAKRESKTTIEFVLGEEPGSLYKSLRCFADRDIALSKIESRPIINTDWQYRFYLDVLAGKDSLGLNGALKELSGYVSKLNILGSYSKGKIVVS